MNPPENASAASPKAVSCPAWKICANPIVRRYARSRLRPQGLALWPSLTLLLAGLMVFIIRTGIMSRGTVMSRAAEPTPLQPRLARPALSMSSLCLGLRRGGIIPASRAG